MLVLKSSSLLNVESESERTKFPELLIAFICSESEQKMGDELASLLEVYHLMQKAGRSATLTLSSKGGNATIAKLVIELNDASSTSTTSSQSKPAAPASGSRRHRRRGKAARAKANARAAQYQAAQAKCAASLVPGDAPSAPLDRALLPPPPAPGIPITSRRLMTVIRRRANTWTSFNQLDGATEETPPPPSRPRLQPQPPICYEHCDIDEHCDDCGKCEFLCSDHFGCDCELIDHDQRVAFECAICYCRVELIDNSLYCRREERHM